MKDEELAEIEALFAVPGSGWRLIGDGTILALEDGGTIAEFHDQVYAAAAAQLPALIAEVRRLRAQVEELKANCAHEWLGTPDGRLVCACCGIENKPLAVPVSLFPPGKSWR